MCAGLSPACECLVGLDQRFLRADVEPAARNAPAVDRSARIQPLYEPPGLIRVVSLLEILPHEPQRRARIEVERDPGQRAPRLLGLLLEPDNPVVAVELDHRIPSNCVDVADVVD